MKRYIGVALILLLTVQQLAAQNFPVSASVNITPPYSVYLSDYIGPGSNKLMVNLLLTQTSRPSFPVKLRITLQGDGYSIRTNIDAPQEPIILQGGVLTTLTGSQLAPYLEADNLIFEGIDRQQFLTTGKLPEGVYQITVEAFEVNRNLVISNPGSTIAFLILNDPPRFNSPQHKEVVRATEPQRVFFQWLPLHRNSPNAAFTTEYEFTIVEVYPAGRNANDAVLAGTPIAQIRTINSSLLYDQSYPALIPGREYAIRVQARDAGGLDLFRNNGFSEAIKFTFGESCDPVVNVRAESETPLRGKIQWDAQHNHSEFIVKYREANNPDANWFESRTFSNSLSLTDLKPGTAYEYSVTPICGTLTGNTNQTYQFTTLEEIASDYEINCGNGEQPASVDASTTLTSAYKGIRFKIGMFDLKATEVSGSNGTFSGEGEIFVPYLASTIKVSFSNIKVNANREVYEGEVRASKTGLGLLSAAEIAEIAASQSTNELKNDICQPIEEDEGGDSGDGPIFKNGDIVITLDSIKIAKGDTIQVNGEDVIVDENTKFEEGDKVVVDGKEVVVGQDTSAGGDGTNGNGGTTGGGANVGEQASEDLKKKIDNFIESALKTYRDENDESLDRKRDSVNLLTTQMKTKIDEQGLIPEVVIGVNEQLVGEGMSANITVPDEDFADNGQPVLEIYRIHRDMYVKDVELSGNKAREQVINRYLGRRKINDDLITEEFIDRVYDLMGAIGTDSLNYYDQRGNRNEIEAVVLYYVGQALEQDVSNGLGDLGFHFDHSIDPHSLFAYEGRFGVNDLYDERSLYRKSLFFNNVYGAADTVAMTPAVMAEALHKIIVEKDRKVGLIDPGAAIDLPIGLSQNLSGIDYVIAIQDMVFRPSGASFDAFMSMEVPFAAKKIAFSVSGVSFTPGGMTVGSAKMLLMKDYPLRISNNVQLTLKATDSKTYVEFDCKGFKSLAISGEFEFCENLIVPDDTTNTSNGATAERVKARFETTILDWNNFLVSAEIDPFQLPKHPGLSFSVTQAVLDMSDELNPSGIQFPEEYYSSYFIDGNTNMWRGFYLQQARVKLPSQIKEKGDQAGKRKEFEVNNLIIDEMGFTGEMIARNLITDNGDLGGWSFTLDELRIVVEVNQFKEAGFKGTLDIPIAKGKNKNGNGKAFAYQALIHPGNEYSFSVTSKDSLEFDLWAADVLLKPGSTVEVAVIDKKFKPSAILHGEMNIGAGEAKLFGIGFEGLKIQTERPRLTVKAVSFSNGKKGGLAKFPITITDIGIKSEDNRTGLDFKIRVNLMGEKEQGFAGDATMTVWGKEEEEGTDTKWKFDKLQVNQIGVEVVTKAYEIRGRVTFIRGDQTYGNGFKGELDAKFTKIGVKATALFGKVNGMRYWYVDALAVLPQGVPILPPLEATGFGGGAYHHMRQRGFDENAGSSIGATPSGIVYLPDKDTHLGIKATVLLAITGKPEIMNADVTLEVNFNRRGGVNQVAFYGNAYFITDDYSPDEGMVNEGAKNVGENGDAGHEMEFNSNRANIRGHFRLLFDNENDIFHGETEMYIKLAGGLVQGVGKDGRAGWCVIHFAPGEWYIHVGSPDDPIGMKIANIFESRSYLMVGDYIPASPPPPQRVSDILGGVDLDYMRDENTLASGRGFAFGMHFAVDTGDITFLIFYARLAAGAGFDIMLKDYGDARCAGRSGTLGINGWYANGQAYAYVEGKIGIKIKIFGKRKKFSILELGVAAILQTKGPDPFWMRGMVGGRYRILGGLIKGNCRFEFTIGEECEIIPEGSPLDDLNFITEITPADGATEVNVFNASQAVFSMPVNKVFELMDFENQLVAYRAKLDHFTLKSDGSEIQGQLTWNDDQDVVAFDSYDILPAKKKIVAEVQIGFEERQNGVWVPVKSTGGDIVKEVKKSNFTSGEAPDHIPHSNVAYSYPVVNQFNFYKDEASAGYIKLKKGQPDLFRPGAEWVQKARFTDKTGNASFSNISYTNRQVNYTIPSSTMKNGNIYNFQVVNLPAKAAAAIDKNVKKGTLSKGIVDGEASIEIETRTVEGTLDILQEKEIYGSFFRTSTYPTFLNKFNTMTRGTGWRRAIRTGIHELGATMSGAELFDKFEVRGDDTTAPLIQFEAKLSGNNYYTNYVFPLVYSGYPVGGFSIQWRNPNLLGVPPVRGIYFRQYPSDRILNEQEVLSGTGGYITNEGAIIYNLIHYYARDYQDLQGQVAGRYYNGGNINSRLRLLLESTFPKIRFGDYKVNVKYVMPGTGKVSSMKQIVIQNPVPDGN
ncbi:MAG: fibronectin type III domain-containing protein [Bacteroidota bacterium]